MVIAVIGLLSSIIFAITSGTREQGRIAKGLYFSQHLHNSLGSYAAGIWNFDEGSGATANDTSGWDNNGTLVNSPTWRCASTDAGYTPSGQGCSLEFNGVDDYVNCGNPASLAGGNTGTVETWIKPNGTPLDGTCVVKKGQNCGWGSGTDGYGIVYTSSAWRGTAQSNNSANFVTFTSSLSSGWNHLVFTWVQEGQHTAYLNGVKVNEKTLDVGASSNYGLAIGHDGRNISPHFFNGYIDEVRIYATALTVSEIQSRYCAGLYKLLVKDQITQDEYQQRLAML